MSLIAFSNIQDATTADAADVNGPLNTIFNDYNGNIDSNNIADDAIIASKISAGAVGNTNLLTTAGDLGGAWAATTCTITVVGGTAPSYSANSIRTTVIGKTVIATWLLTNTSGGTAGAGTGLLSVSLPFNSLSGTRIGHGSVYNGATAINGALTIVNVELVSSANGSTAYLAYNDANISGANQNNANRYIYLTATYESV